MLIVAPQAAQLDALFIWAPAARCGVTLLQRLISSSRDLFVYGENGYITKILPHVWATMNSHGQGDNQRERLAAGDFNFWSSAASPDTRTFAQAVLDHYYQMIRLFQHSARKAGFKRWGIKEPDPEWGAYEFHRSALPKSRHIFLVRHIEDVIKSYKSRTWVKSVADVEQVSTKYNNHVKRMLSLRGQERLLYLRHEDMVAGRQRYAAEIVAFLELPSVDISVFDKRINTFATDRAGESPTGYVEPTPLLPDERAAMLRCAGEALQLAGYDERPPAR